MNHFLNREQYSPCHKIALILHQFPEQHKPDIFQIHDVDGAQNPPNSGEFHFPQPSILANISLPI